MKKINIFMLVPLIMLISIIGPACGTGSDTDEMEQHGDDFPIPWPEGGEIITDERENEGATGYVTVRYDSNRYEEVVEFYDDYASGSGWNRSELGQGEVPGINYMNLSAGYNISVGPPDDQFPDAFIITLIVS